MQVGRRSAVAVALLGGAAALLSILSSQWVLAVLAAATALVGVLAWLHRPATGEDGTVSPGSLPEPVRRTRTPGPGR